MLVLSRKRNEAIWIGPQVRVVICECGAGRVKIGIEAPRDVNIVREELRKKKDGEILIADVPPPLPFSPSPTLGS